MKTHFYTIICFLFCGILVHTNANSLSAVQSKNIEHEVDAVFTKMLALAEKLDFEALNKGVSDKYNAGFILNGRFYATYAELDRAVNSGSNGVQSQTFTIHNKKLSAVSENIVLLTATGSAKVLLEDGRTLNINFNWSFVYEKIDDNWKVIQSHQSRS